MLRTGLAACLLLLGLGIANAAELRVLTENYPPFNLENPNRAGEATGVCVALVREILDRSGQADTAIELWPWSDAYGLVQERPGTALFSTTRTAEREERFAWVGPLAVNRWALFAKAGSGIAPESLEAAKAYRIGTYRDDAVDHWLRDQGLADTLASTTDDRLNATKLMQGRIDLWAGGESQLPIKFQQAGHDPAGLVKVLDLRETLLYIAVHPQTDPALLSAWREALAAMHADGAYRRIFEAHGALDLAAVVDEL